MAPHPDELLTVPEVAFLLRIHVKTCYRWVGEGLIPSVKVGRTIRVRRADIEHLLAAEAAS